MRELAVQAPNATNSDADRANLDNEFEQLRRKSRGSLAQTKFNGKPSWRRRRRADLPDRRQQRRHAMTVDDRPAASPPSTGDRAPRPLSNAASTAMASDRRRARHRSTTDRADLRRDAEPLRGVISNLQIAAENQSAARSRIMDADFAAETANLSRAQILQQAGNAMVAQANQLPQQVLQLLRN